MTLRPGPGRWSKTEGWVAVSLLVLFIGAEVVDRWAFHHLAYAGIYRHRWGLLLRMPGYLPLWAIAALALVLHDWTPRTLGTLRAAARRGWRLLWTATLGGAAAEALKLVVRRERPNLTDGVHVFRAWSDRPFSSADLGLPSSEVAVAFAAAAILARLFPRASLVWYGLAAACAATRVAVGAHFLSDVTLGALVGYLVALGVARRPLA